MKDAASHTAAAPYRLGNTTRRGAVIGLASLVVGLSEWVVGSASAQHTHPAAKKSSGEPAPKADKPNAALIAAARRCETVGNICLRHCIRLTRAGDKSIADCMRTVQAMLPVCNAMRRLATQDARRLKDLVKVCMDTCADCEAECRKHEFHHVECKNCAEACAATVEACKALLAA